MSSVKQETANEELLKKMNSVSSSLACQCKRRDATSAADNYGTSGRSVYLFSLHVSSSNTLQLTASACIAPSYVDRLLPYSRSLASPSSLPSFHLPGCSRGKTSLCACAFRFDSINYHLGHIGLLLVIQRIR